MYLINLLQPYMYNCLFLTCWVISSQKKKKKKTCWVIDFLSHSLIWENKLWLFDTWSLANDLQLRGTNYLVAKLFASSRLFYQNLQCAIYCLLLTIKKLSPDLLVTTKESKNQHSVTQKQAGRIFYSER